MSRALRHDVVADGERIACDLHLADGRVQGTLDGEGVDMPARRLDAHAVRLTVDGRDVRATVAREGGVVWVAIEGRTIRLTIEESGVGAAHHAGEDDFAASPMTGTLAKLSVAPGEEVAAGAELFVVEAMKMEYVVRAPRDVTVAETRGVVGEQVEQGGVVVTYAVTSAETP